MLKTCFFSLYPGYEYSFVEQLEVLKVIFLGETEIRRQRDRERWRWGDTGTWRHRDGEGLRRRERQRRGGTEMERD